jgi:Protein of unknown function (DUF3082)
MTETKPEKLNTLPSPLRSLTGAIVAGGMAIALYNLMGKIATVFAAQPTGNRTTLAVNIAAAVKTLVLGSTALGTGVFGIIAMSLVGLAIQVAIKGDRIDG